MPYYDPERRAAAVEHLGSLTRSLAALRQTAGRTDDGVAEARAELIGALVVHLLANDLPVREAAEVTGWHRNHVFRLRKAAAAEAAANKAAAALPRGGAAGPAPGPLPAHQGPGQPRN